MSVTILSGLLFWGGCSPELARASTHLRGKIIQKLRYLHDGSIPALTIPVIRKLHGFTNEQPTIVPVKDQNWIGRAGNLSIGS